LAFGVFARIEKALEMQSKPAVSQKRPRLKIERNASERLAVVLIGGRNSGQHRLA
jgi:hypothetical protein